MPTGVVKKFEQDQGYGFVAPTDGGKPVYVKLASVEGGNLQAGDEVEYEVTDSDGRRDEAVNVKVTHKVAAANPVGRVMASPPSWDELEEIDRQNRMNRRRRR